MVAENWRQLQKQLQWVVETRLLVVAGAAVEIEQAEQKALEQEAGGTDEQQRLREADEVWQRQWHCQRQWGEAWGL